MGILRDVTARKRADTEILQKSSDINLINIINEAANQGKAFERNISPGIQGDTETVWRECSNRLFLSEDKQYLAMENLNLPPRMAHGIEKIIGSRKIPGVKIRLKPGSNYARYLNKGKAVLTNDPRRYAEHGKGMFRG